LVTAMAVVVAQARAVFAATAAAVAVALVVALHAIPGEMNNLKGLFFNAFASRPRPAAGQIMRPSVRPDESDQLRELLAAKTATELTDHELKTVVEGNLWMLTSEAFLYFLLAFLHAALESYS